MLRGGAAWFPARQNSTGGGARQAQATSRQCKGVAQASIVAAPTCWRC